MLVLSVIKPIILVTIQNLHLQILEMRLSLQERDKQHWIYLNNIVSIILHNKFWAVRNCQIIFRWSSAWNISALESSVSYPSLEVRTSNVRDIRIQLIFYISPPAATAANILFVTSQLMWHAVAAENYSQNLKPGLLSQTKKS